MKLATFTDNNDTRIGVVDGDEVVDLSRAAPELPREMLAFLEAAPARMEAAHAGSPKGAAHPARRRRSWRRRSRRPPKFLGIGPQLRRPRGGVGARDAAQFPTIFNKQSTCVVGPRAIRFTSRAPPT